MNANRPLLVVEDEAIIAMDIRSELQSRGWTVGALAGSEAKALAAIASQTFAGAVLDINLGAKTSFDVGRALAERGIPFVFLTGANGAGHPEDIGQRTVLAKPVNFDDLHAALKSALDC